MKKTLTVIAAFAALFVALACETAPTPEETKKAQPVTVKSYPPQILEHKGTAFGRDLPKWMDAALEGSRAVEKLPDFAGQYVVVVQQEGSDLAGTQLVAGRMDAQAVIAQMILTRVKDSFAGAQVGDQNKLETYVERCIKSAADARYTGFVQSADTWVKLQNFTSDGKPDKQVYRAIQIWTIDKNVLQQQISQILKDAAAAPEEQTADKQKAIDLVQKSFMSGF